MDMVPDIVRSSQKTPHQLDEEAIEREIVSVLDLVLLMDVWNYSGKDTDSYLILY